MNVDRPIFVIGTGRSGSTILHKIFSEHPNVSWLSGLCNRFPALPAVNRCLMHFIDYPVLGRLLRTRISPSESYTFWDYHFQGFQNTCRDLRSEDVTNKARETIQRSMAYMLTTNRDRLLVKITGWPRLGFLKEIFPDARFVHIVRDGRAVVNSMINMPWWEGWSGPQNWRWGELTSQQQDVWERYNRSFVALAAIQVNILLAALDQSKTCLPPDHFVEIKYEDFCAGPCRTLRALANFADLEWSEKFEKRILRYSIHNRNSRWEWELTSAQKGIVQEILSDNLHLYGYL